MKRKLDEIIGEGRRCQYCDRPLRPNAEYVRVLGHLHEIPTADQLKAMEQPTPPITHAADAVLYGYRKERVFRFRHSSTWDDQPYTEIGFWTGGYRGQGWIPGEGVLFCNHLCATYFAVDTYKAGMRIKSDGRKPV